MVCWRCFEWCVGGCFEWCVGGCFEWCVVLGDVLNGVLGMF